MYANFKRMPGYLSYQDCQAFLPYLEASGGTELVEASGGTDQSAPMTERVGAVVNSVKELHASRFAGELNESNNLIEQRLSLLGTEFSGGEVPEAPEGTTWVGVFYLSALGDEYQGEPDVYGEKTVSPKHAM